MDDFGDFDGASPQVLGPLIGGGAAQVGSLLTRLLFSSKPGIVKWAPLIGSLFGGAVGGALMATRNHKATGFSALITASLVGIPRQVEDMMREKGLLKDGFGVTTAEEINGYGAFGDDYGAMGAGDVQLLDSGAGSTGVLGVTVAEDGGMAGPEGVELLGGFGSNWLAQG